MAHAAPQDQNAHADPDGDAKRNPEPDRRGGQQREGPFIAGNVVAIARGVMLHGSTEFSVFNRATT